MMNTNPYYVSYITRKETKCELLLLINREWVSVEKANISELQTDEFIKSYLLYQFAERLRYITTVETVKGG